MDIPELDFYAKNKEGEILIKGANVCESYYKEKDEQKSFDSDGWFFTNDIGKWLAVS